MKPDQIETLPSYQKLVKRRAKMIWGMSSLLVIILLVNLYLMSWGAELGGAILLNDGVITVVVAYSIFVVFAAALAAALYVWWANNYLDPLIDQVTRDSEGEA